MLKVGTRVRINVPAEREHGKLGQITGPGFGHYDWAVAVEGNGFPWDYRTHELEELNE